MKGFWKHNDGPPRRGQGSMAFLSLWNIPWASLEQETNNFPPSHRRNMPSQSIPHTTKTSESKEVQYICDYCTFSCWEPKFSTFLLGTKKQYLLKQSIEQSNYHFPSNYLVPLSHKNVRFYASMTFRYQLCIPKKKTGARLLPS